MNERMKGRKKERLKKWRNERMKERKKERKKGGKGGRKKERRKERIKNNSVASRRNEETNGTTENTKEIFNEVEIILIIIIVKIMILIIELGVRNKTYLEIFKHGSHALLQHLIFCWHGKNIGIDSVNLRIKNVNVLVYSDPHNGTNF